MVPVSRRRLLRAALIGLPTLALASSAGFGVLADRFIDEEIAGYDRVDGLLADLARDAHRSERAQRDFRAASSVQPPVSRGGAP